MILYRTARALAGVYFRTILKLRLEGTENVPAEGGVLIVTNHQSNLDPLLLHTYNARLIFTLTKSSAFRTPVMRWIGPRVGAFPTRRYQVDPQAVRQALRYLEEGKVVGVFPEGERSWDAQLKKLRPGTVRLMLKAGVPVIPCGIVGTYEVWPRWGSMKWFRMVPGRSPVTIRYGEPLHFGRHDDRASREAALPEATKRVEDALLREFYDRSDYFEEGTEHLRDLTSPFQRYRVDKVLQLYEPGRDERVLDLGCGWGTFCWALAHRVREMVGLDFSQKSIDLCESRLAESGLDNVSFICADARNTGLEAKSFHLVIAADLMEHLYPDDSRAVIAEAFRLLDKGGRLVIWTPHRGHILEILKARGFILKRDVSHVDYKSMDRLKDMLTQQGFLVEKAYYAESHLPGLRSVERALLARIPMLRRRIGILARKP